MKMLWNNFKVAFAMYSKIPMPAADWDKESMKYAMCFFPWIGLVIGLLEFVCWKVLEFLSAGELFRAAVMVLIPVVITGGIHLDGFLDTMDALSSWRRRNGVWKSSRIPMQEHLRLSWVVSGLWHVWEPPGKSQHGCFRHSAVCSGSPGVSVRCPSFGFPMRTPRERLRLSENRRSGGR